MNSHITFAFSPWILFAILPIVAAILAFVLLRKKRGSKITLNLILSAIFECVVAAIFVVAVSGIRVEYDEEYIPSEAVILVDNSYTASFQRDAMDNFVHETLKQSVGNCKVGVVLFGSGQKVALDLKQYKSEEDAEDAYKKYTEVVSQTEKDCATDIGSALKFVWSEGSEKNFATDPTRTRIVILSDGLETDGDAIGEMRRIIRSGAQLETSFYASNYISDTSIIAVNFTEQVIYAGDSMNIEVTVKSSHQGSATLSLNSDGATTDSLTVDLQAGTQKFIMQHKFESDGFHELVFRLEPPDDEIAENNVFCTYFEVAENNKILILERYGKESKMLESTLAGVAEKGHIDIVVEDIRAASNMLTANDLAQYSEVILYNGAADDMTSKFLGELQTYVEKFGGGLFTVGGFEKGDDGQVQMTPKYNNPSEEIPAVHSYKEADLKDSILAELLPVNFEAYEPSVAVVMVFDVSRSMTSTGGAIHTAVEDARYICDHVLDKQDNIGILMLEDSYHAEDSSLIPMTKIDYIKEQFDTIEDHWDFYSSTSYAPALTQATRMLSLAPPEAAKKHIILFSDGGPGDKKEDYLAAMADAERQEISITVVTYYLSKKDINGTTCYFNHSYDVWGQQINIENMEELANTGGGSLVLLPKKELTLHGVAPIFEKDLKLDQLEDLCYQSFKPRRGETSSIFGDITDTELENLELGGYFLCRRKLGSVSVPLTAHGSPLYAEWAVGSGKVGSIMVDLEGVWSGNLLNIDTGRTLVENIVLSLLGSIRSPNDKTFDVTLFEDNLRTQVNIFNTSEENDLDSKVVAMVIAPDSSVKKYDLGALSKGSRFVFDNADVGVYKIYVAKVRSTYDFLGANIKAFSDIPADEIFEYAELFRAFSYSKEFDGTENAYSSGQDLLASLSTRTSSDGLAYSKFIYDAKDVFSPYGVVHRIDDFRRNLLICAMVLYLVGITFRFFKIRKLKLKSNKNAA